MPIEGAFNLPFKEAQKYIEGKKQVLPTETWRDITQSAHSKAFVIAGVANLELLTDVHGIIAEQMENGVSFSDFRKNFRQKVAEKGWTKFENETRKYQAWRTKVIYNTNMQAAFAAGKWQQITSDNSKTNFPFLQYVHNYYGVSKTPRADHLAWNGVVLPVDDPFWQTHYPPNGFGCKCGVKQLTKSEGEEKLKGMYNSTHTDKIENFTENYGEEKALKTMRKYAGAFTSQDAALNKSGWAYNVGVDDLESYQKQLVKIAEMRDKGGVAKEYADKIWQHISENSPQIFKNSLAYWNEKHYGNDDAKLPPAVKGAMERNKRIAGILSEERIKEINDEYQKNTGKNVILSNNPIVSINELQFRHGVRIETGHITPPKDFFSKIAKALSEGKFITPTGDTTNKNSVLIEFDGCAVVLRKSTSGLPATDKTMIYTFYEKK